VTKLSHIKPAKAAQFIEDHGWVLCNRKGTHETYAKTIDGKVYFCQVIYNNKTIYPRNVEIMIKKSLIPEEEWIERFG